MKFPSRRVRLPILLLLLAIAATYGWQKRQQRTSSTSAIPTSGGEPFEILIESPHYFQADKRWAQNELGKSGGTLASYGCTICCAAMALEAIGISFDPGTLNRRLTDNGGFTDRGLLIWESFRAEAGDEYKIVVLNSFDHAYLDDQLRAGNPIIAKVLYEEAIWHWVLITGKSGHDYLISDPLNPIRGGEKAISYPSGFFAIRHLQRS